MTEGSGVSSGACRAGGGAVRAPAERPFVAALMLANFGTNVALIAPIQNVLPRMVEAATGAEGKAIASGW